jgi:precorrin-2/cobalt-factor-2 C20-methyltransferase
VGVGPGDPELLTLKAARVLASVRTVAFFARRGSLGNAFAIAERHLDPDAERIVLHYPYTVELPPDAPEYIAALESFFTESAHRIAARLEAGKDVAVLCEGDPLFYGSFIHLHDRLARQHPSTVIPGITSFAGCVATAGVPLVSTDRVFAVVPGTLPEPELERHLRAADAVVIIKIGRHFPKVRRVLERLGRMRDAIYFERGTTDRAVAMPLVEKTDDRSIYFALIVVPGHEARSRDPASTGNSG